MKKLLFVLHSVVITIVSVSLFSCSSVGKSVEKDLVKQTLEDFLFDVANKAPERFHFADKKELEELGVTEETWSDGNVLSAMFTLDRRQIDDRWQMILEKINENLQEEGFDWDEYTIKSCNYNKAYVLENIDGVESYGAIGTVDIESNGNEFSYGFLITIANGKALYINEFDDKLLSLQ